MALDFNKPETKNTIIIISVASIFVILIIMTFAFTLWTVSKDLDIAEDPASQERLGTLNKVLSSYFGMNWPYVLMILAFMLIMFIILLYLFSRQSLEFNISEKAGKTIYITLILFVILFAISMIVLAYYAYRWAKVYQQTGNIDNFVAYQEAKKKTAILLGIVTISLLLLAVIAFAVWYFFLNKPKK